MRCPTCELENPAGARFCNQCGARIESTPSGGPSGGGESGAIAPDWFQALFDEHGNPRLLEPPKGVRRIEFGILGRQPKKWVAEANAGDRVRVLFARGEVFHRAPHPWERSDTSRARAPWTSEKEGALLLIVGPRQLRYADIRNGWVEAREREQVYVGIKDSKHDDNEGSYTGVVEVVPAAVRLQTANDIKRG